MLSFNLKIILLHKFFNLKIIILHKKMESMYPVIGIHMWYLFMDACAYCVMSLFAVATASASRNG